MILFLAALGLLLLVLFWRPMLSALYVLTLIGFYLGVWAAIVLVLQVPLEYAGPAFGLTLIYFAWKFLPPAPDTEDLPPTPTKKERGSEYHRPPIRWSGLPFDESFFRQKTIKK